MTAYDPVAILNAKKILGNQVQYAQSLDEVVLRADAIFIITEWHEFKQMDVSKIINKMKSIP